MTSNTKDMITKIKKLEDYEQVSEALMEIVHREPVLGGELALDILRSKSGDVHLRAFAFSMLYQANRPCAFEYIRENSKHCEPAVYRAMLGEVVEDFGVLDESTELQKIVKLLRATILDRPDINVELTKRGVGEFLAVYGD